MKKDIYDIMRVDFTLSLFNELKSTNVFNKVLSALKFRVYLFNILFIGILADFIISENTSVNNAIEVCLMIFLFIRLSNVYKKKNFIKRIVDEKNRPSIDQLTVYLLEIFSMKFLNNCFKNFKKRSISQSMRFKLMSFKKKEEVDNIKTYNDVIKVVTKISPDKIKIFN